MINQCAECGGLWAQPPEPIGGKLCTCAKPVKFAPRQQAKELAARDAEIAELRERLRAETEHLRAQLRALIEPIVRAKMLGPPSSMIVNDLSGTLLVFQQRAERAEAQVGELRKELDLCRYSDEQQRRRADAAEAKVDSLMLEYCPDEMPEWQKKRWADNQRVVSKEETAAIYASIKESKR